MTKDKNKKEEIKKVTKNEKKAQKKEEKESLFERLGNFINGVKTEFKRVKWPGKKEMVKYSIATITFVVCCSLFFYIIDIIIAALHSSL